MRKFLFWIVIVLIISACGGGDGQSQRYTAFDKIIDHSKPVAFGEDEDIYVFCGLENRNQLEPLLLQNLEREVQLVYPEKYFNIIFSDIKDVTGLSNYKNLLFLGSLDGGDPVSRYLKEALDANLQTRITQSGGDIIISKNRFTRDQLIIHVVALDKERLVTLAQTQANRIFSSFLMRYTQRLAYQTYQSKVIPASFFEPYPFSLQIPENYTLYSNDKDNRFLSFLYRARMQEREIPDKFLSVYYQAMESDQVDAAWLISERQRIGKIHFEGDSLNVQTMRTQPFEIAGYRGYRLTSAWINPGKMAGGALQCYAFWDADTKKAWLIDTMVYFPAGDKLPTLMELFMLASSFKTK
ncbi:MAG: DUF4837 family protein [Candidatus Cloacimonetes bacterium]|nr:DUF4837 family protein [Candidatus Cloacimonadota bacterium]NLO11933.1 DUF4837 family protein [Candidatus Cloacimonadota bacterium]